MKEDTSINCRNNKLLYQIHKEFQEINFISKMKNHYVYYDNVAG